MNRFSGGAALNAGPSGDVFVIAVQHQRFDLRPGAPDNAFKQCFSGEQRGAFVRAKPPAGAAGEHHAKNSEPVHDARSSA